MLYLSHIQIPERRHVTLLIHSSSSERFYDDFDHQRLYQTNFHLFVLSFKPGLQFVPWFYSAKRLRPLSNHFDTT